MKDYRIKVLYGILVFGILISIFHIINDKGGSGLGNVIDTFTITSIILFLSTLIYIFSSFKENIKKISVWFLLILSCPLAIMSMTQIAKEYSLELTETTTPNEFLNSVKINPIIYERDKIKIQNLVDSLIKNKTVESPSELTSRYFNGKAYNDTIERDWAIDLPTNLEYKEIIVDTLFYAKNNEIIAGLLINNVQNQYMGNGFLFNKNNFKPIEILKYSISSTNYKSCSEKLRYYYLKKIGTYEGEYNLNDIRFFNAQRKQ